MVFLCLLAIVTALVKPVATQTGVRRIAWDQPSGVAVTGWALTVDGVRSDLGLTPQAAGGSCSCSIPLPFSGGRHTLVVSAYNSGGETASAPFTVGPTANAGGPYAGTVGGAINVSAAASTDASGTITSYVWNWGDGSSNTTSSSASASHAYASGGTFTITLTVNDNYAASGTATTTASISAPAPQAPGVPSSPDPWNGNSSVSAAPILTWSASNATRYDVRFGTSNPPPQVTSSQTAASYTPGALAADTRYFWSVVARNSSGTTAGPVWTFTTLPDSSSSEEDVVIYASDVAQGQLHGGWRKASDSTSPGGVKLASPDNGWASLNAPLASPPDYVDVTFAASANTAYTLWLRLRASGDSKFNDAVWLQFSDARANGSPIYQLNSSSGLLVNLATDSSGGSLSGWGWQHSAYWLSQPATLTFASTGSHTLRIQLREDGVELDQIVLSPGTYMSSPPGAVANDSTIVPRQQQAPIDASAPPEMPNTPNPSADASNVSRSPALSWVAPGATTYDVFLGSTYPPPQVVFNGSSPSYTADSLAPATTYYWRVVGRNSLGWTSGPLWWFTTTSGSAPPQSPPPSTGSVPEIVIYASDVPSGNVHGSWTKGSTTTGAGGVLLRTADADRSALNSPLAVPSDYVDVVFDAPAGTAYTLWLRLRALNDSKYNDAVWVQFSDARADGSSVYPLNSTSGLLVNLATDSSAWSLNGWGWQNGAYWLSQPVTVTFATSGSHTMRLQIREDGVQLDQVVLSSERYRSSPPGSATGDSTIVPKP